MTSVTWDRHRGHAESYDVVDVGFNFRMDEPRAAIAYSKLARLPELLADRRAAAAAVREAVADLQGVRATGDAPGAAPQAVGLVLDDPARRDAVAAGLGEENVSARPWPDAWMGAALPPAVRAARARTVLVDLGAAEGEGLEPPALAAGVRRALTVA
jgi:dTDP-4-amino-4,6-dideoxygalactose transaminase